MADTTDSKSVGGNFVRVQVPPSAPNITNQETLGRFFILFNGGNMTKETFKSFVKSINLFEICWVVGIVFISICSLIFMPDIMFEDKTNVLLVVCSTISVISSPICEMLISKQCRWWTMFSLVFVEITDIVVLFSMKLYSSALISLLFWIPLDIITFVKWGGKNKDEEHKILTKVKSFSLKQNFFITFLMIEAGILFGVLLSSVTPTELPYVVALSNVFEIFNGIFLLTRHSEQWIAWFGYLIMETIIWTLNGHYIMLITIFAMLINTMYGFTRWFIYIKNKKEKTRSYGG